MTMTKELTEEWVLFTHKCSKYTNRDQWDATAHESAHFFANPPSSADEDNNKTNDVDVHHNEPCPTEHVKQESCRCDLSHLPLPSRNFFLKGQHCYAPIEHVEYSLFKKNVLPKWEDPQCQGEWFVKHYFPPDVLDGYWLALVRGVMSGQIDSQHIAGIRVVDKSHSKHPLYRIEIWLNTAVQKIRDHIRDQAMKCITMDPHYAFKFHWRKFDLQEDRRDFVSVTEQPLQCACSPMMQAYATTLMVGPPSPPQHAPAINHSCWQ